MAQPPSVGPIRCVTATAPDLDAVADCYGRYLGYRVLRRAPLDGRLAAAWNAEALAGRPALVLAPAAADDFVFRFIEAETEPGFVPFASHGWNAAELIVRNVDALAEQLEGSPFEIVGAPANLSFSDDIRAMQVLGPGRELLYLTEFKQPVPGLDVPTPRCDVDRTFIVILGGPSMTALQDFFVGEFGVARAPVVESRVKGMSAAFGRSPETRYPIAALGLAGQCLVEVDEMPAEAAPRPARPGELPPGIAVVSFDGTPGTRRGAAGELIELVRPGARDWL